MYCGNNRLPFSQLAAGLNISDFGYINQSKVFTEVKINIGTKIDFSTEKLIDGKYTTFVWYKDGIIINNVSTSKYTPTARGVYYCKMTNTKFSGLTIVTNNIIVNNKVANNLTLSNNVIPEDAVVGTEVGTISVNDVDTNDEIKYTIADNDNFKVEGDKLVTKSTFDFDKKSEYKVNITATDTEGLNVEKEFTITITEVKTTAIGKAVNANVNLYPNPAVTTITIETSVLINRVDIVNILGNVVYSQTVNATNITVDVSNLQSGIYNIKGYTLEGVITKKFVKR